LTDKTKLIGFLRKWIWATYIYWACMAVAPFAALLAQQPERPSFIAAYTGENEPVRRVGISVGTGPLFFMGRVPANVLAPNANLGLTYFLTPTLGLQLNGSYTQMQDNGRDTYNRKFKNSFYTYSLRLIIQLNHLTFFHKISPKVIPYFYIGGGNVFNNVTEVSPEIPGQAENNNATALFANPGVGLKIYLSPRLDFFTQADAYLTNTPRMTGHNLSQLNAPGSRGNDIFTYVTFGFTLKLGKKEKRAIEWSTPQPSIGQLLQDPEFLQYMVQRVRGKQVDLKDTDQDGVPDTLDIDDYTPPGVRVTTRGLPMDTDYDGIADYLDKCPMQAGEATNNGCPTILAAKQADSLSRSTSDAGIEGKFHIIVSSWKQGRGAERELQKIKKMGYDRARILKKTSNQIGGGSITFHRVSIASFQTVEEARLALPKLREKFGDDKVWIFRNE